MIQLIGIMIGAYIFTRMVELVTGNSKFLVKTFSVITAVITVLCVVGLIMTGSAMPNLSR
jgi:hypothetical protein